MTDINKSADIAKSGQENTQKGDNTIFPRINIYMMLGCLALIILGFVLMSGGSSSIEAGYNPDIFSFRRIVAGPTVAFLGFLLMAVAIIWTPGKKKRD